MTADNAANFYEVNELMAARSPVRSALRTLEQKMRLPRVGTSSSMTRRLPAAYWSGDHKYLLLEMPAFEAFETAKATLIADLAFEYLADRVDEVVWAFAAKCWAERAIDHVQDFISTNAREVINTVCYIPVEYLKVTAETTALGIRLLPPADPEVPLEGFGLAMQTPMTCVAAVPVSGTDYRRMAQRARSQADHDLRLMRVALRANIAIHDHQLRFRLRHEYAFAEGHRGWQHGEDVAYELEYGGELIDLVRAEPVCTLPVRPSNQLERQALIAVRWIERAMFAADPLAALLYLFFGLEALLGDKAEGLKAAPLAFRRAMLAVATGAGFTDPGETFFLYEVVRSAAVHGGEVQDVGWETVNSFARRQARLGVKEYLEFARTNAITKQSDLVRALNEHPDRPLLIQWLRANGGSAWTGYLDQIDPPPSKGLCPAGDLA